MRPALEALLEKAARQAEQAEVFAVNMESVPVQFEANRLKTILSRQSHSTALRLIKDGRIGFAITTGDDLDGLLAMALETAPFGQVAGFDLPGKLAYAPVETYDPAVEKISTDTMVGLGEAMIQTVRDHTPGLICGADVSRSAITVTLLNSRGGQASYRKSVFSLGIEGVLTRGTDMLFVGNDQVSCRPVLETASITKEVLDQLERAKDTAPATQGELPVIFTPQGVQSALIPALMSAFNGKMVLEGASPLAGKLGQVAFNSKLSLFDDATLAFTPAARPCDDEGVPSRRTTLIDGGRVASFLYDLRTAGQAKTQSTGSAARGGGQPGPSPSAFIVDEGGVSFENMIAGIKEGLVVEFLMGAEQGNILGGDFSGNVLLGYRIENGHLAGRVKNTMVSGNVYKALAKLEAVGNDSRWLGGSLRTPSLLCPGLSVAAK